jgi:hypothetical protein
LIAASHVDYLIEIKDDTENWVERKQWLQILLSKLWESRGAFPGMLSILSYLELKYIPDKNGPAVPSMAGTSSTAAFS